MSDATTPSSLVPLADAPDELHLRKESWKEGVFDVVGDGRSFARLDYSHWKSKGKAEAADGQWAFGGKNFWKGDIKVTDPDSEAELAVFDKNTWTRGGKIVLGGTEYELKASGVFSETWSWTRDGEELVRFADKTSFGKEKGILTLTEAGRADPNSPLLTLLSVHVNLVSDQQTAGSMTAVNAAVIAS